MRQLLLTTTVIASLLAAPAAMAKAEDAAYDQHSAPVTSIGFENCVRTKWMEPSDPCAPPPPPAPPAPVAAPAPAPVPMPIITLEQRTIYFEFDSAALTPTAADKLEGLAGIINNSKAIADVHIHGFTDQFGTSSYNEALANRRAAAVKAYLDQRSRLASTVAEVKGLGKASPEEGCGQIKKRDEKIACMAKERRVEIEFKSEN